MNARQFNPSHFWSQLRRGNAAARKTRRLDEWLGQRMIVVERFEERMLPSASVDLAFELLHQRAALNQSVFYVYQDGGSALNHGELTLFSSESPNPITKIDVDANALHDPTSPTGVATDPDAVDRIRGSVLQVDVGSLSAGQFAGLAIRGTANVPAGIDLTGASQLVFEASTTRIGGQSVNVDIGGTRVSRTIPGGNAFTTITIPLTSLAGPNVDRTSLDLLFALGVSSTQAPQGTRIFLDNIRYEATPARQATELGLPLSLETFAVIPETQVTTVTQQPIYPLDQVTRNLATTYEASMTALSQFERGRPEDLEDARRIVDTFVYALGHDLRDANGQPDHAQINPLPTGERGLHDAYQGGDIASGPGSSAGGEVRLAGFSVGENQEQYYLVQDGASGGNNAFAIFALVRAFQAFGDPRYLETARDIGHWIVGTLKDSRSLDDGFGGYVIGFVEGGAPNEGQSPRVVNQAKSIENNADIFAAFSQLAIVDPAHGVFWTDNANHAGDFVMRMYDRDAGRFFAGTAPNDAEERPGIELSDLPEQRRTLETVNVFDFLDSQSFTTLALAGAPRYRDAIDWNDPVRHMLTAFDQVVVANGQTFHGFSLTVAPTSTGPRPAGPDGIAWEFTGQVVVTMQYVDGLLGNSEFATEIEFYLEEIRRAQQFAPFADGRGLVAATLNGENEANSPFSPLDQVLTTPFQAIPERVGLAATNWAIYADLGHNLFLRQLPLPTRSDGQTFVVEHFDYDVTLLDLGTNHLGGNLGALNQPAPTTPGTEITRLSVAADSNGSVGGSLEVQIDFARRNSSEAFGGFFTSVFGLTDTKVVFEPGQPEPTSSTPFPDHSLNFNNVYGDFLPMRGRSLEQIAFDVRLISETSPVTVKVELKDEHGFDVFARVTLSGADWRTETLSRDQFNRSVQGTARGTGVAPFDWSQVSLLSVIVERNNVADGIANPTVVAFRLDNLRLIDLDGEYPDLEAAADPVSGELNPAFNDAFLDQIRGLSSVFFLDSTSRDPRSLDLPYDRSTSADLLTVGGVGFELTSFVVDAEQGYLTRANAAERVRSVLDVLANHADGPGLSGTVGYQGFKYHFLGPDGNRKQNFDFTETAANEGLNTVELSTIDTALMIAGAITTARYFTGPDPIETEIRALAHELYASVNWPFMLYRNIEDPDDPKNNQFYLGWKPTETRDGATFEVPDAQGLGQYSGVIGNPATLDYYTDEALLVVLLAMASPTEEFRVGRETWDALIRDDEGGTFVKSFPGSLFTYQFFSHWVATEQLGTDNHPTRPVDWFENTREAIASTIEYVAQNPEQRATFANSNHWGLAATEGPFDDYFAEAAPDAAIHFNGDEPLGAAIPSGGPFALPAENGVGDGSGMSRDNAVGGRTVQLDAGETRTLTFDLDGTAFYEVRVRYSNDNFGPLETVTLHVNSNSVGSFAAQDTGDFGSGWNSFLSSGAIGVPILLTPGRHTVTISVAGGDGFGVEIDEVRLDPLPVLRPLEVGTVTSYGVGASVRHLPAAATAALWTLAQRDDLNQDRQPELHPRVGLPDALNADIADALLEGVDHADESRILRGGGAWANLTQFAIDVGPMLIAIDNLLEQDFVPNLFMSDPGIRQTLRQLFSTATHLENAPPTITSAGTLSVPSGTRAILTVTAIDPDQAPEAVTFALVGGSDRARFQITEQGVLTWNTAPNFEQPTDADGDNVYFVEVQADDGRGGTVKQTLNIAVTNKLAVTLPSAGGSVRIRRAGDLLRIQRANGTDLIPPRPFASLTGLVINGSEAADTIVLDVTLAGFAGELLFQGSGGADKLDASKVTFGVTMIGGLGKDTLLGGAGDDLFHGGLDNDSANGGAGSDRLFGDSGNDVLLGGAGTDSLNGGDGNDRVDGGTGDGDSVTGGLGRDTLIGGAGLNDQLVERVNGTQSLLKSSLTGVLGQDSHSGFERATFFGGDGNDLINAAGAPASLSVTLIGQLGNDTLTGGAGSDVLQGGEGNDALSGSGGDDTLAGQAGTDTLTGGAGSDALLGGAETDRVLETGNLHFTLDNGMLRGVGAGGGTDTLDGIEEAHLVGGAGNNTLNAGAFTLGPVTLRGEAGRDTLTGTNGDDSLRGGAGNDLVHGGAGNDDLHGDTGRDTLLGGQGSDTIHGGADHDVIVGAADDDLLFGEDGNDTILGGVGFDRLSGGNGNDTLDGDADRDTLLGEAGIDALFGGADPDDNLAGGEVNHPDGVFADATFFQRLDELLSGSP